MSNIRKLEQIRVFGYAYRVTQNYRLQGPVNTNFVWEIERMIAGLEKRQNECFIRNYLRNYID